MFCRHLPDAHRMRERHLAAASVEKDLIFYTEHRLRFFKEPVHSPQFTRCVLWKVTDRPKWSQGKVDLMLVLWLISSCAWQCECPTQTTFTGPVCSPRCCDCCLLTAPSRLPSLLNWLRECFTPASFLHPLTLRIRQRLDFIWDHNLALQFLFAWFLFLSLIPVFPEEHSLDKPGILNLYLKFCF